MRRATSAARRNATKATAAALWTAQAIRTRFFLHQIQNAPGSAPPIRGARREGAARSAAAGACYRRANAATTASARHPPLVCGRRKTQLFAAAVNGRRVLRGLKSSCGPTDGTDNCDNFKVINCGYCSTCESECVGGTCKPASRQLLLRRGGCVLVRLLRRPRGAEAGLHGRPGMQRERVLHAPRQGHRVRREMREGLRRLRRSLRLRSVHRVRPSPSGKGGDMCDVPRGRSMMGCNSRGGHRVPEQRETRTISVTVPAFKIDKYEVTDNVESTRRA